MPGRAMGALGTLAVIMVITASWWALALWPAGDAPPEWLMLTRAVCFGTSETGLPDAGGWLVLMGQPLSMLLVLFAGWGRDVRDGVSFLSRSVTGQMFIGTTAAMLFVAAGAVALRVRVADATPFTTSTTEEIAGQLTRINDKPRDLSLLDQHGDTITLDRYKGRPIIVTFAYAHCTTICPVIVSDVLSARDKLKAQDPVVLVVTLDPWRDTPSRLPSIADQWGLTGDAHVLSGSVDQVERVLTLWRVPRIRNEQNGELSHPTLVYIIDHNGRIAYALNGTQAIIRAAIEAL